MRNVICYGLLLLCFSISANVAAQFDERFYFPSKKMEKIAWPVEELTFPIGDEQLSGIWLKPKSKAKASIVYFHGSGGNVSTYVELMLGLLEDGFQVIMIDFRGYGRSTGTPTHLNIAQDAQLIFDQIKRYPEIQDSRVIIMGASMGTQVAARLTRLNAAEIHALVLDGAMSSFTDIALASSPKEMHPAIRAYLVSPYSAKEDVQFLNGVKLLMIHSKGDKGVPIEQAREVFDQAKNPKVFWEYEGGHLDAPIKHKAEWLMRMNALLSE